jgi:hypothetical protein
MPWPASAPGGGSRQAASGGGQQQAQEEAGHKQDAAAGPRGARLLVVGSMDGSVTVLDASTGAMLAACRPHAKYVVRAAPDPCGGGGIATASFDQTCCLLRLAGPAGGGDGGSCSGGEGAEAPVSLRLDVVRQVGHRRLAPYMLRVAACSFATQRAVAEAQPANHPSPLPSLSAARPIAPPPGAPWQRGAGRRMGAGRRGSAPPCRRRRARPQRPVDHGRRDRRGGLAARRAGGSCSSGGPPQISLRAAFAWPRHRHLISNGSLASLPALASASPAPAHVCAPGRMPTVSSPLVAAPRASRHPPGAARHPPARRRRRPPGVLPDASRLLALRQVRRRGAPQHLHGAASQHLRSTAWWCARVTAPSPLSFVK